MGASALTSFRSAGDSGRIMLPWCESRATVMRMRLLGEARRHAKRSSSPDHRGDPRARRTGTIVNLTSDAGVQAYAGWGAYGTSKAALEQLSRVLAQELKGAGIRVYVVDPGEMNTQMYREAEPEADVAHMPRADSAAAALVALIAGETTPFGRFELRRWAARDQLSTTRPAGIR